MISQGFAPFTFFNCLIRFSFTTRSFPYEYSNIPYSVSLIFKEKKREREKKEGGRKRGTEEGKRLLIHCLPSSFSNFLFFFIAELHLLLTISLILIYFPIYSLTKWFFTNNFHVPSSKNMFLFYHRLHPTQWTTLSVLKNFLV